jgi:hypothetical protein
MSTPRSLLIHIFGRPNLWQNKISQKSNIESCLASKIIFFGLRQENISISLNRHGNGISLPWQENRNRNF